MHAPLTHDVDAEDGALDDVAPDEGALEVAGVDGGVGLRHAEAALGRVRERPQRGHFNPRPRTLAMERAL